MAEMEFIKFSRDKVVGKAQVELLLTEKNIDTIMSLALEGGIGYWAVLNNSTPDFDSKPNNRFTSEWATQLILDGKSIEFYDVEDEEERWTLDLEKIVKGFTQNYKERPFDNNLENGDATTGDCIIQYALFGKLVYG